MIKEILDWITHNGQAAFIGGLMICGVAVAVMRLIAVLIRGWPKKDSGASLEDIDG